jgi:hypothetical protein
MKKCELCSDWGPLFYYHTTDYAWIHASHEFRIRCKLHKIRTTHNPNWHELTYEEYLVAKVMAS